MASSTNSRSSGPRSRDDASPGPWTERQTASSSNNNPVRAGQTVILLFPLLKVLRCTEDDCHHSYAPVSWTSRVQSLLRHLEQDHGFHQLDKIYRCTRCDTVLTSRPTTHACLRGGAVEESASPARYRCDRCSASFPSSRGLLNHQLWHRDRDARQAPRGNSTVARTTSRRATIPEAVQHTSPNRSDRVDDGATPLATASVDPPTPPGEVTDSAPDVLSDSPTSSPHLPAAVPPDATHDDSTVPLDARDTNAQSRSPPSADTHPDPLGGLTATLRQLLTVPPTGTTWQTCEESWARAVLLVSDAVRLPTVTQKIEPVEKTRIIWATTAFAAHFLEAAFGWCIISVLPSQHFSTDQCVGVRDVEAGTTERTVEVL
ncbi:hypothetical protein HPB50_011524 [Hyalomma asiaticum]|uniref:Uncharacterized protein n=1 Tax=Hyalomma asiaticum TaxID=266040 RepID=A0ACB7T9Q9_HYAAI|nr:hypothetical protein HPB50_011524 [Hyalomma asiaticum]